MPESITPQTLYNSGPLPGTPSCMIYVEATSARLNHVCEFIFNQVLGVQCEITKSSEEFEKTKQFKINYSNHTFQGVLQIPVSGFVHETALNENKPVPFFKNGLVYFFKSVENPMDSLKLDFDLFSSVFYFISRCEEWQRYKPDQHCRFILSQSLLYQNKFHLQPVLDLWILEFKNKLLEIHTDLHFPKREAKIISTLDIDNLFAYKSKGMLRTLGASCKDLFTFDFKNFKRRWKVIFRFEKDPFDIYDEVSLFCETNHIPLVYFFLFKTGTAYDRTVDPSSQAFTEVFERLKKYKTNIGLHPSYFSTLDEKVLKQEFKDLEARLDKPIVFSRQHFLKFDIRTTPQLLIHNGVIADFSMGYSDSPGFRAGTSFPFKYYDFEKERSTKLILVPFCFMDGAYSIHNKIPMDEVFASILRISTSVQKTGGFFVSVFHERSFSDHLYPGFASLYNKMHLRLKQDFGNKN